VSAATLETVALFKRVGLRSLAARLVQARLSAREFDEIFMGSGRTAPKRGVVHDGLRRFQPTQPMPPQTSEVSAEFPLRETVSVTSSRSTE